MLTLSLAAALAASPLPSLPCLRPRAVDGDTIRCANIARPVRLIGIDAPELPGHCRTGRKCAPGNPVASRVALAHGLRRGRITLLIFGTDHYARPLALVRDGTGLNLACRQLARGAALYVRRYDPHAIIARECGL